MQRRPLRAIVV